MRRISVVTFVVALLLAFAACGIKSSQEKNDEQRIDWLEKGKSMATASFNALSAELKAALAEGGVPNAISKCNVKAIPLIDSLSAANNAIIKRVSDRYRNPEDKPTPEEARIIDDYRKSIEKGLDLNPVIVEGEDDMVTFYAPIVISNAMCLSCHGEPDVHINASDMELINSLYPEDKAIGYREGDLRGIWSIAFNKGPAE